MFIKTYWPFPRPMYFLQADGTGSGSGGNSNTPGSDGNSNTGNSGGNSNTPDGNNNPDKNQPDPGKIFSTGYAKGIEKGKEEILNKLKSVGIDVENLDEELKKLNEIKNKGGKNSPEVEELKKALEQAQQRLKETDEKFKSFLKETKIDSVLNEFAIKAKTIDPKAAMTLFKTEYQIDLDEKGEIVIQKDGKPVIDYETGNYVKIEDAFKKFLEARPYLLQASGHGGSGGGSIDMNAIDLSKLSDKEKAKLAIELGPEKYKSLVDQQKGKK